ncbi:MAG: HYR domain-containing protein, partial [Hyphomicrobiaceae bacterium]
MDGALIDDRNAGQCSIETFTLTVPAATIAPLIADGSLTLLFQGGSDTGTLCTGSGPFTGLGTISVAAAGTITYQSSDDTPPVITPLADITEEAVSAAGNVVSFTPTASDDVGVTSLTSSPPSGSTFPIGTTVVTVTAADAAGNSSTATFNVTITDTGPPVIT